MVKGSTKHIHVYLGLLSISAFDSLTIAHMHSFVNIPRPNGCVMSVHIRLSSELGSNGNIEVKLLCQLYGETNL